MIIHECQQRSPEWYEARRGVITASELDRILTPVELKRSTQATSYRYRLLAEWLTGKSYEGYSGKHTERGIEQEPEARDYYQFLTDKPIREVGFIYKDETRLVGCSPDGVIGDKAIISGVEIKCVDPHIQVGCLLAQSVPREHILQIQGAMWITNTKTWDFFSYSPDLKPLLITVKREPRVIDALRIAVDDFLATMLREREILLQGATDVTAALEASLKVLEARP